MKHIVCAAEMADKLAEATKGCSRISVGGEKSISGWHAFEKAYESPFEFVPDGETLPDDPMQLYFTSGTTSKPKLVMHSHTSYPVGHLSTMYWIGIQPGDVHCNLSSPGWAKHSWTVTCAVECRGNSFCHQSGALQRTEPARHSDRLWREYVLRTANRMADAGDGEFTVVEGEAARAGQCRRAAESGSD